MKVVAAKFWEMNPDGTERRIISDFKGNIEGFSFSPDAKDLSSHK